MWNILIFCDECDDSGVYKDFVCGGGVTKKKGNNKIAHPISEFAGVQEQFYVYTAIVPAARDIWCKGNKGGFY